MNVCDLLVAFYCQPILHVIEKITLDGVTCISIIGFVCGFCGTVHMEVLTEHSCVDSRSEWFSSCAANQKCSHGLFVNEAIMVNIEFRSFFLWILQNCFTLNESNYLRNVSKWGFFFNAKHCFKWHCLPNVIFIDTYDQFRASRAMIKSIIYCVKSLTTFSP